MGRKPSRQLCATQSFTKKGDLVEDYISNGIGFDKMPPDTVEEYGLADIVSTRELFLSTRNCSTATANAPPRPTFETYEQFLARFGNNRNKNGIKIDFSMLNKVQSDYQIEKSQLQIQMEDVCHAVMGDKMINFASPEQLSQLIYSRRVTDKKKWAETFNIKG